jgi:aminocarboxymuconate-semialdehyde decarboxylase
MKAAETGVGQIIIGIDYPFPWNRVPVDHVLSIPGLSDDDKIAILGGTAAKLLGIKA